MKEAIARQKKIPMLFMFDFFFHDPALSLCVICCKMSSTLDNIEGNQFLGILL